MGGCFHPRTRTNIFGVSPCQRDFEYSKLKTRGGKNEKAKQETAVWNGALNPKYINGVQTHAERQWQENTQHKNFRVIYNYSTHRAMFLSSHMKSVIFSAFQRLWRHSHFHIYLGLHWSEPPVITLGCVPGDCPGMWHSLAQHITKH